MKTAVSTSHPAPTAPPPPATRHRRGHLPRWRGVFFSLAAMGCLPIVSTAQDLASEPEAAGPASPLRWSPEGQQLLAVVLGLAALLFTMERLCAWRLRVRRHRTPDAPSARINPRLGLPALPSQVTADSQSRALIVLIAAAGFQALGVTLCAQTIYVVNADNNVGAYNAATVSPLTGFASPNGLSGPGNVAMAGNTLYVAAASGLYAYNATTGAPSAGFNAPASANNAQGLTVVGNTLYVSNVGGDSVSAYNATTGALLPGFGISGGGIHEPADIAVTGNVLYLARGGDELIGTYNATTGAPINASFISLVSANRFPFGPVLAGNTLYVSDFNCSTVSE